MPFDQSTRNRLNRFVGDARTLLTEEFTRQLQNDYGMDPATGDVVALARLTALDDAQRETAQILRTTLGHYVLGGQAGDDDLRERAARWCQRDVDTEGDARQMAKVRSLLAVPLERIVREQAFTILNRLCAIRMAEARGVVIESVGQGYRSRGFPPYQQVAGSALGETGDAYRHYLFSLFDELAVELPVLFDRFSPMGRLFPRPAALLDLLELINHVDLRDLWAEDETLGWIYQYFNSQEERRQMRAESQAPRNSRELAVRNQFFTPRYVVEFLTDNTLGRIWYEMTQGQTALVDTCRYLVRRPAEVFLAPGEVAPVEEEADDNLAQEELLRQPVYIPFRQIKDPRTILMLDPGCGSMHFGLYSFDLYEVIYSEAWDIEEAHGPGALLRTGDLRPLHETYPDKAAFLRDVPRLIIEHNIHGIDIDLRAVQIAGLSLWLRAQRSWQRQGVKLAERPTIRKSNVVCAEPMPGDRARLEAFLKTLRDERLESLIRRVLHVPEHQRVRATPTMADALCDLVRVVWDEMKLAGEAGSLLKIEESLTTAIQAARDEWEQQPLFRIETFRMTEAGEREAKPQVNYTRDVPGETADFWTWAETLVLAALAQYAERADGDSYARQLFAADAARGFAFIDVCRKRYDVALMNPPFGLSSSQAYESIRQEYFGAHHDMYAAFVRRMSGMTPTGRVGVISSRSFLLAPRLEDFRSFDILPRLEILVDLGLGVMDNAYVESAAYVIGSGSRTFMVSDARSSEIDGDAAYLEMLLQSEVRICRSEWYVDLPKSRILYSLPSNIRDLLGKGSHFEPRIGTAREGMKSFDNERYIRLWWEVKPHSIGRDLHWHRLAKGGGYSLYYSDLSLLLNWQDEGAQLCATNEQVNGSTAQVQQASTYWYMAGVTYSKRSAKGFSARALPADTIFTSNGPAILPLDDKYSPEMLLGWLNTKIVRALVQLQANFADYSTGSIKTLPWIIKEEPEALQRLGENAKVLSMNQRAVAALVETNTCFGMNYLRLIRLGSVEDINDEIREIQCNDAELALEADVIVSDCYEIRDVSWADDILLNAEEPIEGGEADDEAELSVDNAYRGHGLIGFLVGCVLGRWDLMGYLASDGDLLSPFAPLPVCPPGMLQNAAGLPASPADVPADYPLRISWPGILADDPGHPEDIIGRVREALAVIWPENHDAIEQEACQILGVTSLRDYFGNANRFFDDHLKRYSKSRRQAPIYWPLSTASGSYTLWVYYHRLTDQMLYTCVVDSVDPKLKEVSEDVARLRQSSSRSRDDERELERLSDLELELKEFRAELLRLAPIWKPNLNDGVQITAAPLWKLFQHRAWQRTLRETWGKLEAGDYDWAHLALSFWPARVVPKCTTDRSLAIAHDVEDLFWVEDEGRWRPLAAPDKEIAGQRARQEKRLTAKQRERLLAALRELAEGPARGVAASQVAQHLAEGEWDDTELALLCWPERVAEKCLDDARLANALRLNLPAKRTKSAVKRWTAELADAGCPGEADAVLATLEADDAFDRLLADLEAGRRDAAPLALALWPERVIDRCLERVELAAAHDLRKFFWVGDAHGWRRRRELGVEVQMEIERRK